MDSIGKGWKGKASPPKPHTQRKKEHHMGTEETVHGKAGAENSRGKNQRKYKR